MFVDLLDILDVNIRMIFFNTIQNLVSIRHNMVDKKRKFKEITTK